MYLFKEHICICGRCKLDSRDTRFVAAGKKTEFILNNTKNKEVDKYIVDDCLLRFKSREEKCDYLFLLTEDKAAYLIECKGADILKAVDQINSTLNIIKNNLSEYKFKAKIVSTKVYAPNMRTENYKKLREKLNGNLETKNKVCTETI